MVTTRRFYRINRWPIMYNIPAEAVKVSPAVHSGVRKPNQTFAHWLNAFLCKTHWILVASVSVSTLSHLDRSHLSFLARWCESGVCVTRGLVNVWDAESPSPWSGVLCCVCFLLETFARRAGARSSTSLAFNVAATHAWQCERWMTLCPISPLGKRSLRSFAWDSPSSSCSARWGTLWCSRSCFAAGRWTPKPPTCSSSTWPSRICASSCSACPSRPLSTLWMSGCSDLQSAKWCTSSSSSPCTRASSPWQPCPLTGARSLQFMRVALAC